MPEVEWDIFLNESLIWGECGQKWWIGFNNKIMKNYPIYCNAVEIRYLSEMYFTYERIVKEKEFFF